MPQAWTIPASGRRGSDGEPCRHRAIGRRPRSQSRAGSPERLRGSTNGEGARGGRRTGATLERTIPRAAASAGRRAGLTAARGWEDLSEVGADMLGLLPVGDATEFPPRGPDGRKREHELVRERLRSRAGRCPGRGRGCPNSRPNSISPTTSAARIMLSGISGTNEMQRELDRQLGDQATAIATGRSTPVTAWTNGNASVYRGEHPRLRRQGLASRPSAAPAGSPGSTACAGGPGRRRLRRLLAGRERRGVADDRRGPPIALRRAPRSQSSARQSSSQPSDALQPGAPDEDRVAAERDECRRGVEVQPAPEPEVVLERVAGGEPAGMDVHQLRRRPARPRRPWRRMLCRRPGAAGATIVLGVEHAHDVAVGSRGRAVFSAFGLFFSRCSSIDDPEPRLVAGDDAFGDLPAFPDRHGRRRRGPRTIGWVCAASALQGLLRAPPPRGGPATISENESWGRDERLGNCVIDTESPSRHAYSIQQSVVPAMNVSVRKPRANRMYDRRERLQDEQSDATAATRSVARALRAHRAAAASGARPPERHRASRRARDRAGVAGLGTDGA